MANPNQQLAELFRDKLTSIERSQRWLSKQTGIAKSPLSLKLRGKVSFTFEEAVSCSAHLGIEAGQVIGLFTTNEHTTDAASEPSAA